jgi:phosphatidylserine/phosphatidylglycerophosphate/cardiolipin synthase-like enzyme
MEEAVKKGLDVTVVTRTLKEFNGKDTSILKEAISMMEQLKVKVIYRKNIHQKFAIIDKKISWYGSINLLSYGSAEESIMRLVSNNIAYELLKSIEEL